MRYFVVVLFLLSAGCTHSQVTSDCNRLVRIQHIPMKATYTEILASVSVQDSNVLDTCIAAYIVNDEPVKDPSEAPPVSTYVLGDTAFFLLASKYEWNIPDFLDESAQKDWQDQGIYAYFTYVSLAENRRKLSELVSARLDAH